METPDLERRLAAIVAADVEGYSSLMHSDEEVTMATLSARRLVIDALIVEYRGRIANTAGDSVLAEFASVLDAVSCAVEIQKAMVQANEVEQNRPMHLRIGINVGDVMIKEGDIFGDGVNVAARLEGLAEGDGICVSRGVRDHLRNRANFVFEDLGEQLVKNIAHPVRAYRLRHGEADEPASVEDAPILLDDPALSLHDEMTLELALWNSVKDGGADELASYLEHYPDGTFASLARTRSTAVEEPPSGRDDAAADLDVAFWDAIKETQADEELRAYLEQHPDGHFASLARARIGEGANTAQGRSAEHTDTGDQAIELAFWESMRDTENPALLDAYLNKFREGEFVILARARIEELQSLADGNSHRDNDV